MVTDTLFSHLSEHGESDSASVCAYVIIPIEAIPRTGSENKIELTDLGGLRLELITWLH